MIKMKDSGIPWIGQIPENWEFAKYKFFASFYNGNSIKDEEKKEFEEITNTPYISTKDIDKENSKINYNNGLYIKEKDIDFRIAHKDSCLICIEGGSAGKKIGFLTKDVAFVNKLCCVNPKMINDKFSYYILLSDYFNTNFNLLLSGLIGGVTVNQIKNINIAIPPKEIQQKIVEILDKKCGQIDELVSLEENEIEKLKEYKTSLITKVVTKGLDPNAKMKDSGTWQLDRIPTNWQLKKLLYYLEMPITDGPHETPTLRDDGIPFISAESIKNNSIDFSKMRGYISNEYNSIISKKYSPKTNDIFIIKSGATTGNVAYAKDFVNFNIWSPLAVIRVNKYNYWKFIFYVLQSIYFQQQIQLSWSFGTQQNLSMRVLETLKIASPDIKVQHQIVECLDKKCEEIDNLIKIKQEKIEKMKEYKKSLIYQYVTGKKEV